MAINAINGIAVDTSSIINGISGLSAVNGESLSGGGGHPFTFIDVASTNGTGGGITGAIDATGATLFVAAVAAFSSFNSGVADSELNTWNVLVTGGMSRLYYCISPITSASQTFNTDADYSVLRVLAFSSTGVPSTDGSSGSTAAQPGSITPTGNGRLIVTAMSANDGALPSVDGGFTAYALGNVGGTSVPGGIAYLLQTTAAATNPTWSSAGSASINSTIGAFKV